MIYSIPESSSGKHRDMAIYDVRALAIMPWNISKTIHNGRVGRLMLPVENIIDRDRVREKNEIFRRILHTCHQAQGGVPEKLTQLVGGVVIVSTCSENQLVLLTGTVQRDCMQRGVTRSGIAFFIILGVLLGHLVAPAHLVGGGELSAGCECACKSEIVVWVQCSSLSISIAAVG
jgi:hypothetical protein